MNQIEKLIRNIIYGKPVKGIPVSEIKTTTHSIIPDNMPNLNDWFMENGISAKYKEDERVKSSQYKWAT